jgi:tRNA modification GTPase
MRQNQSTDTIAAIATAPGRSAIGAVRLSGPDAAAILSRVFHPKRDASKFVSHRMEYGTVQIDGVLIDEVMAVVMRAPRSYTREDTAEIYAHGGHAALRAVLDAVIKSGARPANPGEFTQRAFLNGRIDLAQAEAVMDVINAKTDAARSAGLKMLGGGLSGKINALRDAILKWLAHIELSIDYPEHEAEAMNREIILSEAVPLIARIDRLIATSKMGRIITDGVRTAIIGRPNVGKSSLLNAILNEDRAIVTEIPGTTRDILSEPVNVHGIPLLLSDTAGIHETDDLIERQGIDKAIAQAEAAALVLLVVDASAQPDDADFELMERVKGKQVILVLNKSDKPQAEGWNAVDTLPNGFNVNDAVKISAKNMTGFEMLFDAIRERCMAGLEETSLEADIITRERHGWLLTQARDSLAQAVSALNDGVPEDLVSVDLREAYRYLGEITGEEVADDIVDRIFSEFCVGK